MSIKMVGNISADNCSSGNGLVDYSEEFDYRREKLSVWKEAFYYWVDRENKKYRKFDLSVSIKFADMVADYYENLIKQYELENFGINELYDITHAWNGFVFEMFDNSNLTPSDVLTYSVAYTKKIVDML